MVDVLENKRVASRFRILVEIAERQPAVSQGEIAEAVGVTSQAVSEYIRELVEDGYVEKEGRSRYHVTNEGVDWLFGQAAAVRQYADHVTEDVLESVREDAAIAAEEIAEGDRVTLYLEDGILRARPGTAGPATGIATTDAEAGQDVAVTGFEGVIELDPGTVTVIEIPAVRNGGSRAADVETITEARESAALSVAVGVEAIVAGERAGIDPDSRFAGGAVAAEAAGFGLDVAVLATSDIMGRVVDELRDAGVEYDVVEVEDS